MAGTSTVYLLDPQNALFEAIEIEVGDHDAITWELECESADSLPFDENHTLYFDDAGLRAGISHYTILDGYPDPLGGKLLLAANDAEEGAAPYMDLAEALNRFHCFKPVMDPVIETSSDFRDDVVSFISGVTQFNTRIVQIEIKVLDFRSPII